ncbi:MAG TPA: glycoside hydrolase family 2 TIM barrel-domain containing protein [Draconibacterium sp.]|nr:glycoside hydrolase family 2 TIM barrel-domain containing protein [Draconibacterium sp.]
MKYFIPFIFIFAFLSSSAQEVEFFPDDWQNPAVFEKGQNPSHAFHIPYSSRERAIQNLPNRCENYQLLNGMWKFKWVETPAQVPQDFWLPDFDVEEWDEIAVPSDWQMEGYGHPKFRNVALSFESDPPGIPAYYNPTGCYKRKFELPESWKDKEVMLRFEGIKSASYVWVNGKRVGYNQGGFEPAEYNITPFLKKGENDLSVEVLRFCDGSYLENQDMWRLSGIFRDVKLYAQPKTYIHDHYVVTDLDKDYKDATLKLELDLVNTLPEAMKVYFEMDVLDGKEQSILAAGVQIDSVIIDSAGTQKVKLSTLVVDPPLWSAEFPNLFSLIVVLKDEKGNTLEAFNQKIGFREVEYNNDILTVNGIPIKLNGVNSHMHDPKHGQAVPIETLQKDLFLMKQNNINCVRTSHYPPTPEYIEMADELGIYIFDEVGDEAHDNIQLSEDPAWTEMYRDRSRKLVYRDRNHPSVIVWSAGNESGSGENIHEVIKTGKAIDPSRPAWMYGGNTFYIPFEDIVGPRYWVPIDYKNLAEGKILPENDHRASFMDEYLAATGNGMGGMDEYWEYIWKYPRLTGGAIWDWMSPGIETPRWILPDMSETKNDGQIMGRPVFQQGVYGWGLEFSGHDDWVEFYRDPSLDITGNQLAISFWVKPSEIPQSNVFLSKGKYQYGIQMEDPQTLEFYIYSGKRISAKAKVGEDFYGNWHHIAGIYDGRSVRLYIDQKQVASIPFNGNISSTPFPLCIGREAETQDQGEHSGRLSKMVIDEVKIFSKAIPVNQLNDARDGAVLRLNFEEDTKDGWFYAVGLGGRTYGVVWPDRTPQPEVYQMKKSGQPVKIDVIDVENGRFRVINRHQFRNLNTLQGSWELSIDGVVSQRGFFDADIVAGDTSEIKINYRKPRIDSREECLLTISFLTKEDYEWAAAGHEIAWEQFKVPTDLFFVEEKNGDETVSYSENENQLIVSGKNFRYIFDKNTGEFASLQFNGTEYLEGGPVFNVWRAPTANDIDPWGSYMFSQSNRTPGYGRSIDNQLRTLGMRDLVTEMDDIEVWVKDEKGWHLYKMEQREMPSLDYNQVMVKMKVFSNSSLAPERRLSNFFGLFSAFERNEIWTFSANGKIELEQEIIPNGPMPDMLQKVGLQFELPKAFNQIEYYGRGPFENYPDRKTGAKVAQYHSTADSMYVPYLIPQEYGNRCDVRWLKVQNEEGRGLLIKGDDLLNFSMHKYTTDNISRAIYTYQLKEAPNTILNVDYEVSGVGGTAIRQLQKYRVKAHVGKYKLTITPF